MRRGDFGHGGDGARSRRVDRRRDHALRLGDQFALFHLLADQHDRPRRAAEMLLQRQVEPRRHRHDAHRLIGSRPLVVVRMHAPVVAEEVPEEVHESHVDLTRLSGFGMTQCCRVTGTGFMTSASVGHLSTQFEQPVQASRKTLCICLAAPMMASVGHTLLQRQQPMHNSSATMAIFGPSSDTPERSTVRPSLAAMAAASALPPGGQQVGAALPSAIAVGRAGAAGKAALPAVGAGHHGDQFLDQRVAFDLQELVGDAEDDAERGTEQGQTEDGGDHAFSP